MVAFYRDANVALVTPLRDGMNLVAKEFVASQDDDNPGVLILSPFAGAGGRVAVHSKQCKMLVFLLGGVFNVHFDQKYITIRANAGSIDGKSIRDIECSDGFR